MVQGEGVDPCLWFQDKGREVRAFFVLSALVIAVSCGGTDIVPIGDLPVDPAPTDSGNPIDVVQDTPKDTWSLPDSFKPIVQQCPHAHALCDWPSGYLLCDICTPHKHAYTCDCDGVWQDETLPAPVPCNNWCMPAKCP